MTIQEAKRQAVPMKIALGGTPGSGKTYSSLLLASGLAGPGGKIGFLDTEAGRGSMYADDPLVKETVGKYYISSLDAPFTPERYAEKVKDFVQFGVDVLIIDSISHEWEGFGGCQDIAENHKTRGGAANWALAKIKHRRLMNSLLYCPMHVIFCLRAREKTKPKKNSATGKIEMVQEGLSFIQEFNFIYEMDVAALMVETNPGHPISMKCAKPLEHLFPSPYPSLTREIGDKMRQWSIGGESVDSLFRDLKRECREQAMSGTQSLDAFFLGLKPSDKELLSRYSDSAFKAEVRALAKEVDTTQSLQEESQESELSLKEVVKGSNKPPNIN
jgi:hypothetical protein